MPLQAKSLLMGMLLAFVITAAAMLINRGPYVLVNDLSSHAHGTGRYTTTWTDYEGQPAFIVSDSETGTIRVFAANGALVTVKGGQEPE